MQESDFIWQWLSHTASETFFTGPNSIKFSCALTRRKNPFGWRSKLVIRLKSRVTAGIV